MSQGMTKGVPIDTDSALTGNSDLLVPSQKAVKTYVDNLQLSFERDIFIEVPIAKTYTLIQSAKQPMVLDTITYATVSGTVSFKIQINGVDVTGFTSLSASSSPATATATAAKTISAGQKVTLVVSSVSSPQDFTASIGGLV